MSKILLLGTACVGALLAVVPVAETTAAEHAEGFDGDSPSWRLERDKAQVRLISHRRNRHIRAGGRGQASEHFILQSGQQPSEVKLFHTLPPARVIPDLSLSLWVRSNRNGATLWLRVVFPHQKDPTTGAVLSTWIPGDAYTSAGRWQELRCTADDMQITRQIHRERARLSPERIDVRDPYVDRAIVTTRVEMGTTELFLDDLRFGPVVAARPTGHGDVVAAADEEPPREPVVRLLLGRLLVEGKPLLPRFIPDHGEPPEVLEETGLNVVWVPDLEDSLRLSQLRQHQLWAMATPPRLLPDETATVQAVGQAELEPFAKPTEPILLWNLGTRIPPRHRNVVVSWNEQIRRADDQYKRPVMADVSGSERVISRHVRMLGTSRHALHTDFGPKRFRDWLIEKRKLARPGTFPWTWIQTEAASANVSWRRAIGKISPVVEPEQIRLQCYAALSAGYRGLGFWKTTPLDGSFPGAAERRLAIRQLNLEFDLIETWLATGTLVDTVPVEVVVNTRTGSGKRGHETREQRDYSRQRRPLRTADEKQYRFAGELEAAVFHCDDGTLVLPVWFGQDAQFVPGQMAVNAVQFVVPGPEESAAAWQITTTSVKSLEHRRVAGGIEITLPKFDRTSIVFLSSDLKLVDILRRKVKQVAPVSSQVYMELASAKLSRVRQVDTELEDVGAGQPQAAYLLTAAEDYIARARQYHDNGDYDNARQQSAAALQLLRILQRIHWNFAVHSLSFPASSPYTVSFQTLPDFWRLMARIGRSEVRTPQNLLVSGSFENNEQIGYRWQHSQNPVQGIRAAAELYPVGRESAYSLRMVAVPETGVDPPKVVREPPVTVATPSIPVRAGQVVHASGWIRVTTPVVGSLDGVLIYDSLIGPAGGLRWHEASDWHRFELVRDVQQDDELTLTVALTGLGEVQLDDFAVTLYTPSSGSQPQTAASRDDDPDGQRPRPLRIFDRWPRIRPLTQRPPQTKSQAP